MTEQFRHIVGHKAYLKAGEKTVYAQATNSWEHKPHC